MIDTSNGLLQELNRVQERFDLLPFLLSFSGLCLVGLWYARIPSWEYSILFALAIPMLIYARHTDVTNGTAILNYELEDSAKEKFEALKEAFKKLMGCSEVWHIKAAGDVSDWKRNSGANRTVSRHQIQLLFSSPPKVVSNLKVPTLNAGRQTLYFFPDRILIYERKKVGAIAYDELQVEIRQKRFIEEETVPKDAQVVDSTWKYVNKKGGPDRRFSGNREIPIALYGEAHFTSGSGLNELFQYSQTNAAHDFASTLKGMELGDSRGRDDKTH